MAGETNFTDAIRKLEILRHSLGLDRYGQNRYGGTREEPYRNHYVATPGGPDCEACMQLTADGLMALRDLRQLTGGDVLFVVTEAGRAYVREHSPKPPPLTSRCRKCDASGRRYKRTAIIKIFGESFAPRLLARLRELADETEQPVEAGLSKSGATPLLVFRTGQYLGAVARLTVHAPANPAP